MSPVERLAARGKTETALLAIGAELVETRTKLLLTTRALRRSAFTYTDCTCNASTHLAVE